MTTLSDRPTLSTPAPADHRPGTQVRALSVVAGGALFAVGNLLHPLTHDETAHESPTWVVAHVVFGIGALLIAAGMTVLTRRFAASRTGLLGLGITWLGMVLIPGGALMEAFVRPLMDHHGFMAVEEATLGFTMLAGTSNLVGPALIAIAAIRNRLLPLWVSLAIPGITVGALLYPVLPKEGYGIIPGTVLFGIGIAVAGWLSRSPRD
jgi:hypothetical protein